MRFSCFFGMPIAAVLHAHPDGVRRRRRHRNGDAHGLPRILHRVVEQVGDDGAKLLGVAAHHRRAVRRLEDDRVWLQVMPHDGQLDALGGERGHVHRSARHGLALLADDAGLQHLIDGVMQPRRVGQHDFVELLAAALREPSATAASRDTA